MSDYTLVKGGAAERIAELEADNKRLRSLCREAGENMACDVESYGEDARSPWCSCGGCSLSDRLKAAGEGD